ncbi:cupredoxin domain-containing protein [Candidatus Uhrbacteria bacterium]|nr:cupredoxin domain-containing protein [Candidatus Uhrbacteria bacterium]
MRPNVSRLLIFASAMLLAGAGCVPKEVVTAEQPPAAVPAPQVEAPKEAPKAAAEATAKEPAAQAAKFFAITASTWKFEPAELRVKQGDKVRLTVTSVDVNHGFALPDFNVNLKLTPGQTVGAEFTADKKGTFPFFCDVFCGQGHTGMRGQLIVE